MDTNAELKEALEDVKDGADWGTAAACLAVGFAVGALANWWWHRRQSVAEKESDGEHRMALTFPFL